MVVVFVVAALPVFAYRILTDPQRIVRLAEQNLSAQLNGQVTIGSASFSWFEGVRLFDVKVTAPPPAESSSDSRSRGRIDAPLFECPEVELVLQPSSVLFGPLKIRSVTAHQPQCSIVRDRIGGRTNLGRVLQPKPGGELRNLVHLPSIELRDARLRVIQREETGDRVVEDLVLSSVRGRPSTTDESLYEVIWQSTSRRASGNSRIDLRTGSVRNVEGGLPPMSIEAVMIAVDARFDGAGAWSDLLGLSGTVRAGDYDFSSDDPAGRFAEIELSGASISIPVSEEELPLAPSDRYLRFENTEGTVRITAQTLQADFTGFLHGSRCDVSASLKVGLNDIKTLEDVAFEATIDIDGLILPVDDPSRPAEARFINRFAELVRFYEHYDPKGRLDLHLEITRAVGASAPITLRRGTLTARGANGSFHLFPYRLRDLRGSVIYSQAGIVVRDLEGYNKDGLVRIDAELSGPTARDSVAVTIVGTGISVDEELRTPLKGKHRAAWDQFNPGGKTDIKVTLVRPASEADAPAPWSSEVTLTFNQLSARYEGFPYPLEKLSGEIVIDDEGITVKDIQTTGEGPVITAGGGAIFQGGAISDMFLSIMANEIPLDEAIFSSLPEEIRKEVIAFHPEGLFNSSTKITWNPTTGTLRPVAQITLSDAVIEHEDLPFRIEGVAGELTITPNVVEIRGLTGRYRDAVVSVEGRYSTDGHGLETELTVRSENLTVDEAFIAPLPERFRRALKPWHIEGPIATETTWSVAVDGTKRTPHLTTVVRLEGVRVRHAFSPQAFEDVHATITLTDNTWKGRDVSARYGSGRVRVDFDVDRGGVGESGTIRFSADDVLLDASLRGSMPEKIQAVWDATTPSGAVDVESAVLKYTQATTDGPRIWTVDGRVKLKNFAMPGIVGLNHVNGWVTVSGPVFDRLGGTNIKGRLELDRVDLFDRKATEVMADWSFVQIAAGQGRLELRDIQGRLYNGSLDAKIAVDFDEDQATYVISANALGIDLDPLLNDSTADDGQDRRRVEATGTVDGHLNLNGRVGDPRTREGGGKIAISDGKIFRLPIMLAILNVLNPSTPADGSAFAYVESDFLIMGNRMRLEDLLLSGPAMVLAGGGSVTLPDLRLDLRLASATQRQKGAVPILSQLFDEASRNLVELRVTGPLAQPSVRTEPFRGLSDAFKELFKKKKPPR